MTEMTKTISKNFNDMLEVMYNHIKDTIINNGGFINTSNTDDKDRILSLEFVNNGDVVEWNVLALKVVNDRIIYCAGYECYFDGGMTREELEDSNYYDWFDLKYTDNYYIQTLYNIFENIEEYI